MSVTEEQVPEHVSLNIDAIRSLRAKAGRSLRPDQRAIEAFTNFVGQPRSLYALIVSVALWIAYNMSAPALHRAPFDPSPFFFLQGAIAFYAAIMSTMILITQNRQRKDEERNAHLELQVNLLARSSLHREDRRFARGAAARSAERARSRGPCGRRAAATSAAHRGYFRHRPHHEQPLGRRE